MQVYSSPGHAGAVNGELKAVSRPSMSKLIGGEALAGQPRMANSLQQVTLQSATPAPIPIYHANPCYSSFVDIMDDVRNLENFNKKCFHCVFKTQSAKFALLPVQHQQ